jgi:uncharacterized protein YjiS (DUF1127 family)
MAKEITMTRHGNERAGVRGVLATVVRWQERRRTRRELARFTEWQLKHIGLSRGQAMAEIDKPFWRV